MDLDMKGMGGWFFILSNIYINKTWDWCVPDFPAGASVGMSFVQASA